MNTLQKRPAVRAVLRYDNRYLLAQHNNIKPENIGKWGTPGGRIETSDGDLTAALKREIWEEFQVEIQIAGFIKTYIHSSREHHVFAATPAHTQFVVDHNEVLDIRWLTLGEVIEWHHAGKLHTGFELDAIERSLTLFP